MIAAVMSVLPWPVEPWVAQRVRWPGRGQHLLAHFDDETIVVYQAYRPAIGSHAVEHGRFGARSST